MRPLWWDLIQSHQCSWKWRKLGHRHQEGLCEDTAGRQLSASQGESTQLKSNLLTHCWSWISVLQNYEKINFCCLSYIVSLWYFLWHPEHNNNTYCLLKQNFSWGMIKEINSPGSWELGKDEKGNKSRIQLVFSELFGSWQ